MTTKNKTTIEDKKEGAMPYKFKHALSQNKQQFKGYTVFYIEFKGGRVRMMTFEDIKAILKANDKKWKKKMREVIDACMASMEDFMRSDTMGNNYIDDDAVEKVEKGLYKKYNLK